MIGLGYSFRFGGNSPLELAIEAGRGLSGPGGPDNRIGLNLRIAQSPAEFAVLAGRKVRIDAAPMMKNFDTNNDGRISALEFKTGKVTKFNELDKDRNGTLSADEIRASRKVGAPAK